MATKQRYHHGDLGSALVTEALVQVRTRGAEAVSLRRVAQAVGVSPSAAYAHFPDKTALMAAVGETAMGLLEERLLACDEGIDTGDEDLDAVLRLRAVGTAYVAFAVDEPHLFRHMFGPTCGHPEKSQEELTEVSVAYRVLCGCLDELEERGLLRPGTREGLDLAAWTMVHGFACLVLDRFVPVDLGEALIAVLGRLALSDAARPLIAPR